MQLHVQADSLVDKAAEKAVLGSMMIENSVIPLIETILGSTADAFFTTDHQLIYLAILAVSNKDNNADPILVANELKKTDSLIRIGGVDYLYELQAPIVETESTEFYAQILREKMLRRTLLKTANRIREIAQDESLEMEEVLNLSQEAVFEVGQSHATRGFERLVSLLVSNVKAISDLRDNKEKFIGLPTGFVDFDYMTSGLQAGSLVIIAARPGMGKTTLALNIATNIIIEQKLPVALFSLETPATDVSLRMLAAEAQMDFGMLRVGKFADETFGSIATAIGRLESGPMLINDNRTLNIQSLSAEARRLKGEYPSLGLIILDYLQLLRGGASKYSVRENEISEVSRGLKILAWELNLPIIACAQLSREVERRPSKIPQLSDLRESGAIEQDADIVAFLFRHDMYDDETRDNVVESQVIIAKQRNGPTGTILLRFNKKQMRFENVSE